MDTPLAAVVKDVTVVAAGVFEGVGEDGQTVEATILPATITDSFPRATSNQLVWLSCPTPSRKRAATMPSSWSTFAARGRVFVGIGFWFY